MRVRQGCVPWQPSAAVVLDKGRHGATSNEFVSRFVIAFVNTAAGDASRSLLLFAYIGNSVEPFIERCFLSSVVWPNLIMQ